MIVSLITLLVFFVFIVFFLVFSNTKIKQKHTENLDRHQEVIFSLNQKQKLLKTKIEIANQNRIDNLENIKIISNEIVELQKVFITLISNKKL